MNACSPRAMKTESMRSRIRAVILDPANAKVLLRDRAKLARTSPSNFLYHARRLGLDPSPGPSARETGLSPAKAGRIRAWMRTPAALDCDDEAAARRFRVRASDVADLWERHFADADADASRAYLDRFGPAADRRLATEVDADAGAESRPISPEPIPGPSRPSLSAANAELAARLATRGRPDGPGGYGPPNTGERDYEVDDPELHGWWSVPDSRTPEERARVAAIPPRDRVPAVASLKPGRACRAYLAEYRAIRRRWRRLDWSVPSP